MYTHELKLAILDMLEKVPAVQQVNHLEYWGEEIFFVALQPYSDETVQRTEEAGQDLLQRLGDLGSRRVSFRYFKAGELLPSSAVLYRRPAVSADSPTGRTVS